MSEHDPEIRDTPIADFYYNDLKWCGCANPGEAARFMRDVLAALQARSAGEWSDETRAAVDALLPDTALALSYWYMLDAHDLTEHGGNVRGSWLTKKGEKILKLLQESNLDELL
jgi:hypothetical protein